MVAEKIFKVVIVKSDKSTCFKTMNHLENFGTSLPSDDEQYSVRQNFAQFDGFGLFEKQMCFGSYVLFRIAAMFEKS